MSRLISLVSLTSIIILTSLLTDVIDTSLALFNNLRYARIASSGDAYYTGCMRTDRSKRNSDLCKKAAVEYKNKIFFLHED